MALPIEFQSVENLLPMIFEKGEDPLIIALDGVLDVKELRRHCQKRRMPGS
jgi:hypothetical protein